MNAPQTEMPGTWSPQEIVDRVVQLERAYHRLEVERAIERLVVIERLVGMLLQNGVPRGS